MLKVLALLTNAARRDDRGVTAVEYALLLVLIVAVIAAGVALLGNGLNATFSNISTHF